MKKEILKVFTLEKKDKGTILLKPRWFIRIMSSNKVVLLPPCELGQEIVPPEPRPAHARYVVSGAVLPHSVHSHLVQLGRYVAERADAGSHHAVSGERGGDARLPHAHHGDLHQAAMISLQLSERLLDFTVNILTGLLNAEPYSAVVVTLFRRGDELLKELQEMESTQEIEEMVLRWNTVMSLLEQSIANEEM